MDQPIFVRRGSPGFVAFSRGCESRERKTSGSFVTSFSGLEEDETGSGKSSESLQEEYERFRWEERTTFGVVRGGSVSSVIPRPDFSKPEAFRPPPSSWVGGVPVTLLIT